MASSNSNTADTDTAASASGSDRDKSDKAPAPKTGPCQVCKTPSSLKCSACSSVYYCSPQHQKHDWKNHKKGGGCSPLRKVQDDHYGRYWVATRNIKAGELILKELPVIVSPVASGKNVNFCVSCCMELLAPDAKPPEGIQDPQHGAKFIRAIRKSCRKCGWPVCGIDCEKAPIHVDNECPLLASRSIKFPVPPLPQLSFEIASLDEGDMYTYGIRLIRGLLIKCKDHATWNKIMELQEKNNRSKFASNSWEEENINRRASDIAQAIRQGFDVADLAPQRDWVQLQGILETNGFGMGRHEVGNLLKSRMSGLYLQGSLFSHSCIPNAFRNISYAPTFELQIRAAVDIKKGEMITINYYRETELYGTDKRLTKTKLTSGFVCQCARCMDPTELGTYMSAIICDRCPEKGAMLPATFQNPEEPYRCQTPSCKNTRTRSSVADLISTYHREISEEGLALPKLEEFISRLSGTVLHPNHWLLLLAEQGCLRSYNDPKHLARYLLYGRRWVHFSLATSPGIHPKRAVTQMEFVQVIMLEQTLSQKEAYDRWTEILAWATDSLKYWQIDVELTPPPGNAISPQEKLMKKIMTLATGKLLELRRL